MPKSIFISVANKEHEALRATLRDVLTRAGFSVVVQPDFPHTVTDTVRKLDGLIAPCNLLIHIVGRDPGSRANPAAVEDFFAHRDPNAFLARRPEVKGLLGDCSALTYFQWEPWLALHRRIPVLVYGIDGHTAPDFPQRAHLAALREARCHAYTLNDESARCAQIVADVFVHFGIVPVEPTPRLAPPRFLHHSAEIFLGREQELGLLDTAWADRTADGTNVFCLVAWGGVGKTALLTEWLQTRFIDKQWLGPNGKPALLAYFDWSFYDQGTRALTDEGAARTGSVGDFFEQALTFFGDDNPSRPGKGQRLAELIRQQRTLLILDGLEPLQHPVGGPLAGRLLDPDLRDLLCALAQANPGLCVVSSRQAVADLTALHGRAARTEELEDLPKAVALRLLRELQIKGTDRELEEACEKFGCHALSLTVLGRFLFDAHQGDINRIDRVRDLRKADRLTREERHRTAWKVLEAYEEWLAQAKADGNPTTLAVLRLTGLFDRVATANCLAVLRAQPVIRGLTEAIHAMDADEWNILLHRLERAHLIKLRPTPDEATQLGIDAHPLVREYFAKQLRERQPEAFRVAHSRLFDYLCKSTEHRPDTLAGLQPLYQAVVHGCLAGRQQEACDNVYFDRILRGTGPDGFYSGKKLGAIGADLGAVAAFFEEPWSRLSPNLSAPDQAWLLNEAATRVRARGRLAEAVEPMRVGLDMRIAQQVWTPATRVASNLSELEVSLGRLDEAVADGRRAIDFADRSDDPFQKMARRTGVADALHQAGERAEAGALFAEAERMQAEFQLQFPLLYSVGGFRYADLVLAPAEHAAWRRLAVPPLGGSREATSGQPPEGGTPNESGGEPPHSKILRAAPVHLKSEIWNLEPLSACAEAKRRAMQALEISERNRWLLDIALDHLTLARAGLYRTLIERNAGTAFAPAVIEATRAAVESALAKLRQANSLDHLPKALLTAALHAVVAGRADEARHYLDEAQLIAERGPMPLYLADVHLHRARLFHDRAALAEARRLIEDYAYGRRREELEDAEAVAAHWPMSGARSPEDVVA